MQIIKLFLSQKGFEEGDEGEGWEVGFQYSYLVCISTVAVVCAVNPLILYVGTGKV